ncbi:MAG TPA: hypothetical protein PKE40_13765 [Arachnia sp.]|mgnify:CR=1 FL=1|nr:hypothetical protein [Arachnia sp.]HMT87412.1 hypothetical protein [Arachnia sp.]
MKFGGEYRLRKVDSGRFSQAATELGVEEELLVTAARQYAQRLPDAVASVLSDLPDSVGADTRGRLTDAIVGRLKFVNVP